MSNLQTFYQFKLDFQKVLWRIVEKKTNLSDNNGYNWNLLSLVELELHKYWTPVWSRWTRYLIEIKYHLDDIYSM